MTSTEQLEREAELCRQQLLGTMSELRSRLTPRQMMDRAIDYVSDGDGAEFARNFKAQVVANPLPTTLMSAGLAWLMLAGKTKPARSDSSRAASRFRDGVADAADATAAAGQGTMDQARSAVASIKDAASSTVGAAGEAYEGLAGRASASATAAADAARNLGENAKTTGRVVADFCREQPLVVAGLGIAIGAALGALLPSTDVEDRVMGAASDDIKEEVRETATDTYERAAAVAGRAMDAATEEAAKQGFFEERQEPLPDDAATLVPEHSAEEQQDAPLHKPTTPMFDPQR
ncbi:MAG: hypothetical protein K0R27_2776 [Xanthobacteraceae bacterium]|jgi:hypothetical protein|nr:hypothetical protein [Xanthobacteraceae bacterium]